MIAAATNTRISSLMDTSKSGDCQGAGRRNYHALSFTIGACRLCILSSAFAILGAAIRAARITWLLCAYEFLPCFHTRAGR